MHIARGTRDSEALEVSLVAGARSRLNSAARSGTPARIKFARSTSERAASRSIDSGLGSDKLPLVLRLLPGLVPGTGMPGGRGGKFAIHGDYQSAKV